MDKFRMNQILLAPSHSGVYLITLLDNRYVGSARNIRNRWRGHVAKWIAGDHSFLMQEAFQLADMNLILFEVLELCSENDLLDREQHFIDLVQPALNRRLNVRGGVLHTSQTRQLLSDLKKGKPLHPNSLASLSRPRPHTSPEWRANLSAGVKASMTDEARAARSERIRGKNNMVHLPGVIDKLRQSASQHMVGNKNSKSYKRSTEQLAAMRAGLDKFYAEKRQQQGRAV